MSVALENARLFDETTRLLKETEQRTAELAVINSVQDGLAKELDIQAIYDLVGDRIRDVFDAQVVGIATFDHDNGTEIFRYLIEKGERFYPDPRPIDKIRSNLIQTKQKIVFKKKEEVFAWSGETAVPGTKPMLSGVFVPLIIGDKITSYITLQNIERENYFSDSDVKLLETLANSMSVALENARLFDETTRLLKETEQRTAELAVINGVQEGLAKELDMQGIYNLVGDRVQSLFNAQVVIIATFDLDNKAEHFNYLFENGENVKVDSRPINKLRQILIDKKQTIYIETENKARNEYGITAIADTDMPKSLLFVPLLSGNVIKGYVSLQNIDKENAFSIPDIRLLETLANSMSVALENARLFDETTRLLKETEQRTAELAVINSVQDGLAKELDMQGIYKLIGDRLCILFPDTQTLVIRTFDHESGLEHFHYTIEHGVYLEIEPRPFIWESTQLILTKKPVDIEENYEEILNKHGESSVTEGFPVKSAVFVPMIVGDLVKGSISLQNVERENAFNESDLRLLTTLTNSMSVALENARLFDETTRLLKETEQRTAELGIINSVQDGLASKLDIQSIYDLVGDKIRDVFDTQGISISYYDRKKNFISQPYYFFRGKRIYEMGFELGKGLTSHIISTGQPLLINENAIERFKELGAVYAESESEDTTKSWLGVPLISGGVVTGTIRLENYEREFAYNDSDLSLLQTLANSMSVALENARLFDETNRLLKETEQRTAELAVINSVQDGLAKELDMQGIYDLVGDRVQQLFYTHAVIIASFNFINKTENFNYVFENGEKFKLDSRPINHLRQILIDKKQTIYIETEEKARTEYGITAIGDTKMPRSLMFVPLLSGNHIKGYVSIQNIDKENAFNESDIRLLETLANSMSVALENARLFDETTYLLADAKQRATELSTVNNISKALASQLNSDELIELVGEQLKNLFKANIVYLTLLNKKNQ
ncbi:MAG: GAF domain-containing protein, partial [Panacibacter sp.]